MQKSTLRKLGGSLVVVTFLIGGLFAAHLIVGAFNWFIPLTINQIDMTVYLLYIGFLFVVAYRYAP